MSEATPSKTDLAPVSSSSAEDRLYCLECAATDEDGEPPEESLLLRHLSRW